MFIRPTELVPIDNLRWITKNNISSLCCASTDTTKLDTQPAITFVVIEDFPKVHAIILITHVEVKLTLVDHWSKRNSFVGQFTALVTNNKPL